MKETMKNFLLTVTTMLALASCQKTPATGTDPYPDNEIRFGSGCIVSTKAFTEATNSTLQSNGFNVAAIVDDGNTVMFNKAVTYNNGAYSVSGEHYYFPATGTMSFYAVYPKTQAITLTGGAANLSYSQNTDTDLIAAGRTSVSKPEGPVGLTFSHLLSQVSFTAKGEKDDIGYKIKSLSVIAADGGTYSFSSGSWTPNGTTGTYPVISSDKTVGCTKATLGSTMSFLPGTAKLNVVWECYLAGGGSLISENDATVDIKLTQGVNSEINITFPQSSDSILIDLNILDWTTASTALPVSKTPSATYSVSRKTSVSLPAATLSDCAIVSVDWGDGLCETFQASSSRVMRFSHSYTDAFTGDIKLIVHNGTVDFGKLSPYRYDFFTILESGRVLIEESKEGVFTVNDSGKKVNFAPGNLFWDGSGFQFEDEEYYYPTSWDPDHIAHFFWSKSASVAVAEYYSDPGRTTSDTFFAADGGAIEGWTVLTDEEFDYLFDNALVKNSYSNNTITIDGKSCIVLKPDGFSGTVADSYTAAEWTEAEAQNGLVALPFAGSRIGSDLDSAGDCGVYWSYSPDSDFTHCAWFADFGSEGRSTDIGDRDNGCSVRLVQVAN